MNNLANRQGTIGYEVPPPLLEGIESVSAEDRELSKPDVKLESTDFTDVIDREISEMQAEVAGRIERVNRASGLSAEQVQAIWNKLRVNERLKGVAQEAARTGREYKYRLYSFLAEKTGSHSFIYEAQRIRYGMVRESVQELAKTNLAGAVELFEGERSRDESFYLNWLTNSRLEDFLKNRAREQVKQLGQSGIRAQLEFYDSLPQGAAAKETAAHDIAIDCVDQIKGDEAKLESLKFQLASYSEIIYLIWDRGAWDWHAKQIYPREVSADLLKGAVASGNSKAVDAYSVDLLRYARHNDNRLAQDSELQALVFSHLYKNKRYGDIADHISRLQQPFRELSEDERQGIVKDLYANAPDKLYELKDEVSLSQTEENAIVNAWREQKKYDYLLDPEKIQGLNIGVSLRQEALAHYVNEKPTELLSEPLIKYNLELSSEQQHRVLESILAFKKTDDYRFNYTYCPLLLKYESINILGIDQQTVRELLEVFQTTRSLEGREFFEYYQKHIYDDSNDDQRKLFALRALQKTPCHKMVRALLMEQVYSDPDRVLGSLERFRDDHVISYGSKQIQYFHSDKVFSQVAAHGFAAKYLLKLAAQPPHLLEDPQLAEFIVEHHNSFQGWENLSGMMEQLQRFPKENLTTNVLNALLNYPDQLEVIERCLTEVPALNNSSALQTLCSNPDQIDLMLSFMKRHLELLTDSQLPNIIREVAKRPEHAEKILYISAKAPELLNRYDHEPSLELLLEHYESLKPALDSYQELRLTLNNEDLRHSGFFSSQCLNYLLKHPDQLSVYIDVFKTFSEPKWNNYIPDHIEEVISHPEAWDVLKEIEQKNFDLVHGSRIHYFLEEPRLRALLDLAGAGKRFAFDSTVLYRLTRQPDNIPGYVSLVRALPDDFPEHVLSWHFEQMLVDRRVVEQLLELNAKARFLCDGYSNDNRILFLNSYDTLKPLLDLEVPKRELLFDYRALEYLSQNPEQINEYASLLNQFSKDVSPQALIQFLDKILTDNNLRESVVSLAKKSPDLLRTGGVVFKLYIENPALFSPIINSSERIQKFLVNREIFWHLVEHPDQVDACISLAGKLPDNFPVHLFTENIGKWLTIPEQKRTDYLDIFLKIDNSPSQEVQRLKDALLHQLMEIDNPVTTYNKIESIFIKNNLPTLGKVFKVFDVLYPSAVFQGQLNYSSSPVLNQATPRRRTHIIYRDLLKIHIESANRSLRQYMEVLQDGQSILQEAEHSGISQLNELQQRKLKYFFNKLDTLLINSSLNLNTEHMMPGDSSLEERYENLRTSLLVRPNQTIAARLAEMFIKPAGFESFDQVLQEMKTARQQAQARGFELAAQAEDGNLKINTGDLLKGTKLGEDSDSGARGQEMLFISNILENGSVAKEFLGADAGSDQTPFDTDVSRVNEEDAAGGFKNAIDNSMATGYGSLLFCLKDRGQFQFTARDIKNKPSEDKWELFTINSNRHYGIRTGFPATEIDFMIAKPELLNEPKTMENLYFQIAQNGYYIPVTDIAGKIVFTPQIYNDYRRSFQGLDRFYGDPFDYQPTQPDDVVYQQVSELVKNVREYQDKVEVLSQQISGTVSQVLSGSDIHLKDKLDPSIIGAELLDTGSTGRRTNLSGDYDFDLSLKLDTGDFSKASEIADKFKSAFKATSSDFYSEGDEYSQLRLKGVTEIQGMPLEKPTDIDIGFAKKSELVVYASHDAVKEKLEWIERNLGPEAYEQTIANILLAKQVLKAGSAYKKLDHGGFGGIGTENWILANGGNMLEAFKTFREAAYENGERVSLDTFRKRYKILDPGFNIKFKGHDNYIGILKPEGYEAMLNTIELYLAVPASSQTD